MSKDLEEQLDEMGSEYGAVVARLRGAGTGEDFRRETGDVRGRDTRDGRRGLMSYALSWKFYLTAASMLVFVGLGVFFQTSKPQDPCTAPFRGPHEYQMGIPEMIATQNPDGSWKNDFLTRRNAMALKGSADPAARIAYKKAMRNLRTRGLL